MLALLTTLSERVTLLRIAACSLQTRYPVLTWTSSADPVDVRPAWQFLVTFNPEFSCTMLQVATESPATTTATSSPPKGSPLKTIDLKAFQAVVAAAAEKLKVPGAMVVLRTPQGNFNVAVGTTELGAQTPPTADTHFRIASNTKTMTAALIVLLAQDGKLKF